MRRKAFLPTLVLGTVALAGCAGTGQTSSVDFPSKKVTIIVPFPAGTISDLVTRIYASCLQDDLGQPFIIENREGASAATGTAELAKAAPDGYTIGYVGTSPLVLAPHFNPAAGYSLDDFTVLGQVRVSPETLVVPANGPYQTLDDLLSSETPVVIAVGGEKVGGGLIVQSWREQGANIQMVVNPVNGELKRGLDVGDYDAAILYPGKDAESWLAAGELRGLGTHSDVRLPYWPDIPTFKEGGHSEGLLPAPSNYSVFAGPTGLPQDAANKISAAIETCTADADVLKALGNGTAWAPPEESETALRRVQEYLK